MMTPYLNQTALYQTLASTEVDQYGNAKYNPAVVVRCRRELTETEIKDKAGKVQLSTYTYFFDTSITPAIGEKVDGRLILAVEEYVVGIGTSLGWEVYA